MLNTLHKHASHESIRHPARCQFPLPDYDARCICSCSTPTATPYARGYSTSRPQTGRHLRPATDETYSLATQYPFTCSSWSSAPHLAHLQLRHRLCVASGMSVRQTLRARSLPHAAATTHQTPTPQPPHTGPSKRSHAVSSAPLVANLTPKTTTPASSCSVSP